MNVELDILNAMLSAIGSSGISSTVGRHPGLIRAKPILDRVNRTIQARGYWFNTDRKLKLKPTTDKEFILPERTLKADASNPRDPFVRRGRVMYDPYKHTSAIDQATMYVDVVVQLEYDDLPIVAQDLIRCTATMELVSIDADNLTVRIWAEQLTNAKMEFEKEKFRQRSFNLRDNPEYARIMHGVTRYQRHSPNFGGKNPNLMGG